jgi:uncharacterized protein YbcI
MRSEIFRNTLNIDNQIIVSMFNLKISPSPLFSLSLDDHKISIQCINYQRVKINIHIYADLHCKIRRIIGNKKKRH